MTNVSDLTTTEFADRIAQVQVALIPVGATEQHGPNLAMGVDWRIAEALAHRVAAELAPTAVVSPPLPFGLSAHHMAFPGTPRGASTSGDGFVSSLCRGAAGGTFRGTLVLVTGVGGTDATGTPVSAVRRKLSPKISSTTAAAPTKIHFGMPPGVRRSASAGNAAASAACGLPGGRTEFAAGSTWLAGTPGAAASVASGTSPSASLRMALRRIVGDGETCSHKSRSSCRNGVSRGTSFSP